MAPGCEPSIATEMMRLLREKGLVHGVSLGGGGGGGFLIALCKEEGALNKVKDALAALEGDSLASMSCHTIEVDLEGLAVDGRAVFC
jgi:hypothetical protein